jgi:hypothetical protein
VALAESFKFKYQFVGGVCFAGSRVYSVRFCDEINSEMIIGDRLRLLREERNLSQGEIEKRTGLLRFYISRVENGHSIRAIETLEKMANAMNMQLY